MFDTEDKIISTTVDSTPVAVDTADMVNTVAADIEIPVNQPYTRTLLQKLQSTSSSKLQADGVAARLVRSAHSDDLHVMRGLVDEIRLGIILNRKYSHNAVVKALGQDAIDHVEQSIRFLARAYLHGIGAIQKTHGKHAGDVGIVTGVSYSTSPIPVTKSLDDASSDLFLPLNVEQPIIGVNFHLTIALPNMCATSWRASHCARLSDTEGIAALCAIYF